MKKILSALLCAAVIFSMAITAHCSAGYLKVNNEKFDGTLAQAIISAGSGGTVTIHGTVYTMPIGKNDGTLVTDVNILGESNAKIILDLSFVPHADDNLDVLTIKGNNVTLKDVFIDARWMVDYPLNTFCGTDNLIIENVTVENGIRGGINVMTGGHVLFKNVYARNSLQAGFGLANCGDATNLKFVDCKTSGNWYRSGILICGGYGDTTNVDASGITCYEGYFSIHDRVSGTISGGERSTVAFSAPPKNADGESISTDIAMYYPLEKAYHHIRFGVSKGECASAVCSVKTNCFGFETTVFYDSYELAEKFVHENEEVTQLKSAGNPLLVLLYRVFNSIRIHF